ncbi:class I SAM-dependent methyltransferase [Pedobacter gandavensis]|uniref:class I SAM-dependent methyltransferase n=1 Tax=Pedobacter gandavensis TaxID=2679963 RepID=UPI002479DD3D|nr:class I SAM-dependent methyltransferase [Pedobacter gandavensis]WGQ09531.1 class I SAM-dependent methyltransferase [Pedobacter gandavensis]
MENKWNEDDLKAVGSQLSSPNGEAGKKTGERMAVSNENMIKRTIDAMKLADQQKVLEIGPGNASHLTMLMAQAKGLKYIGIDISETMIEEASRINQELLKAGEAAFLLSDGIHIDFPAHNFHKIFTVNTLYFWKDPKAYATEIYKALKPGGYFCIGFADKNFMEQLPFTKWDFQLYDTQMVKDLLEEVGFEVIKVWEEKEQVTNNIGMDVKRDIIVITAGK